MFSSAFHGAGACGVMKAIYKHIFFPLGPELLVLIIKIIKHHTIIHSKNIFTFLTDLKQNAYKQNRMLIKKYVFFNSYPDNH